MTKEQKKILQTKNTLLRYKLIKDLYYLHKTEDIPTTQVLRKYIYPVYPISRTTLYNILCTPLVNKLKEIEEIEQRYLFEQRYLKDD
jgi:hypothetical protein